MAADTNTRHRPGALKQQNKSHKAGKHSTKGQLQKEAKGRVSIKSLSQKSKQVTKNDRRHQAVQMRKQKREEAIAKKRSRGNQGTPPYFVAVVSLHADVDPGKALELITSCDDSATVKTSEQNITHVSIPRFKQRFSFLVVNRDNLYAVLDAAKVADVVMFVISPEHGIDSYGEQCLSCMVAQGMPASVLVVQGLKNLPQKKQGETKKLLQKQIEKRFPKDKLHSLDSEQDGILVLRTISNQKLNRLIMRESRPHMVAENISFELNTPENTEGTLKVTGFIRGKALSVNGLVHLPGWGDFQMSQIDAPNDPYLMVARTDKIKNKDAMAVDEEMSEMEEDIKILEKVNPSKQESLQSEVIPDPMEGEQTWPTEEELAEAQASLQEKKKIVKRVPKGTSDYQAAWIVDSSGEDDDSEEDENEDDEEMQEDDEDSGEEEDQASEEDDMEFDTVTIDGDTEKYDAAFDVDEEHKMLQKYKEARMDKMFPDEVDTPMDVPARNRYARFRGLKSFRTSPWDPKENLPSDYARIFQFENFKRSKKKVLEDEEAEGALPGWYVTVHISNVPKAFIESHTAGTPVVVFGLLPHEQKMSVIHFLIKRYHASRQPIKSKERMIFHMGYRRFAACPIYSQHTNGDKHKFERFLGSDGVSVATVYAPVMFPPAPVLMFKEQRNGQDLVAIGNLLSVNPNRIIAKRIVLSGHPFKVNKKSAVVRYLFFNREDIMWFKPVELRTKYGRRGHIKEPLGTHGHMKCTFDGQLKSQDTILMNLYKRMYPKWTYDPHIGPGSSLRQAGSQEDLMDADIDSALFE